MQEDFGIEGYSDLDGKEAAFESRFAKERENVLEYNNLNELNKGIEKVLGAADKYFTFAKQWMEEQGAAQAFKDSKEGIEIKRKTFRLAIELEKVMKNYVALDLKLQHYMAVARTFVRHEEEGMEFIPKMEWTSDTEVFLEKHLKNIPKLKEEAARLKEAKILLKDLELKLSEFENLSYATFGEKAGKTLFTSYMSGIRLMNESKAQAALKNIQNTKAKFSFMLGKDNKDEILKKGKSLLSQYMDNMTLLKLSEDRLYLKQSEANINLDALVKEHKQSLDLINKYHYPYLKSRVHALRRLKDRLKEVTTMDHMLLMYRTVMKGMVVSVDKFEDIRMFEASLKEPIDYLVNERSKDLKSIESSSEEVMKGLERAVQNRLQQIV